MRVLQTLKEMMSSLDSDYGDKVRDNFFPLTTRSNFGRMSHRSESLGFSLTLSGVGLHFHWVGIPDEKQIL